MKRTISIFLDPLEQQQDTDTIPAWPVNLWKMIYNNSLSDDTGLGTLKAQHILIHHTQKVPLDK